MHICMVDGMCQRNSMQKMEIASFLSWVKAQIKSSFFPFFLNLIKFFAHFRRIQQTLDIAKLYFSHFVTIPSSVSCARFRIKKIVRTPIIHFLLNKLQLIFSIYPLSTFFERMVSGKSVLQSKKGQVFFIPFFFVENLKWL